MKFTPQEEKMDYIRFGSTGLKVSRICLGCMSFGRPTEDRPWVLNEEQSRPFLRRASEESQDRTD